MPLTQETKGEHKYHGGFRQAAAAGSWERVNDMLGEEVGFVSIGQEGEIQEGSYSVVTEDPGTRGIFLDSDLFNSQEVERGSRYPGGFFFRNGNGDPVELKYRFSDELREYPETVHMHNVPELYVADGRFEMDLADCMGGSEPASFANISIEDEAFVVPAGLYHGIRSREEGSNLMVARGDPTLEKEYVGKWDMDGKQLYDHFPGDLEKPELLTYEEENDGMYRLW